MSKSPKLSIPFSEFPPDFASALNDMRHGRKGRKVYSEATVQVHTSVVGQYLKVARDACNPLILSPENIGLFIDEIDRRKLKNITRWAYVASIREVAKRMQYPAKDLQLIRDDVAAYREHALIEPKNKHYNLIKNPVTLRQVGTKAVKLAADAYNTQDLKRRRRLFIRSGLLAFLSLLPMRIGDVSKLIIGTDISRDQDGWVLNSKANKNDYEWSFRLHRSLTRFLDRLIHFGQVGEFGRFYVRRVGSPLFIGTNGNGISAQYLSQVFKSETGHSAHIVRTLVHDALAESGVNGTETALILCGQVTTSIAKVYEVHAKKIRVNRAQKAIEGIQTRILEKNQFDSIKGP